MLRKKIAFLVVVSLITTIFVSGTVAAQDSDSGIEISTEYDDNESIESVHADSGTIRIGDIEWTQDTLTITISNRQTVSTVSMIDQSAVVGSAGFQQIPQTNVRLGPGETVVVEIQAERHPDFGQIVTVSDGSQVVTLTNDEPGGGNIIQDIGPATWFVSAILVIFTFVLAGLNLLRRMNSTYERVA